METVAVIRALTGRRVLRWTPLARALLVAGLVVAALHALMAGAMPARAADAAFRAWLENEIWPEASAKGISRATFDAALANTDPDRSLPDAGSGRGVNVRTSDND